MKNPYYPYSVDNRHQLEIDYENADYKYNYDRYKFIKLIFWFVIIIGIIVCTFAIIYGSNIIQTISASVLGGLLSLFVWLITIAHQDKVTYELAIIDEIISIIDEHINYLHNPVYFIDSQDVTIKIVNDKNLNYRILHLWQSLENIKSISHNQRPRISLRLKWFDKTDCSFEEYQNRMWNICKGEKISGNIQDITDVLLWNEHAIETQLLKSKKQYLLYKQYILRGNAPVREIDYPRYKKCADMFDKIFNNKRKD